jgi:hypothetical protein
MNKELNSQSGVALALLLTLFVQCAGRTQHENGSTSTTAGAGGSRTGNDMGGTGVGGSMSEVVGGEHSVGGSGATGGSAAAAAAGTGGAGSFPVSPCVNSLPCGNACTQCNTLDGSCYAGTCDVIGDCTTRDPRCGGPKRTCEPTDAQGTSDVRSTPCQKVFGWAWDGSKCIAVVGCNCVGSQCSSLMKDEFTCFTVYEKDFDCGT